MDDNNEKNGSWVRGGYRDGKCSVGAPVHKKRFGAILLYKS